MDTNISSSKAAMKHRMGVNSSVPHPAILFPYILSDATQSFVTYISLPPLFLISTALGGFLFGIFMYYSAGCGAGIFYKIGEKNTGALIAAIGFTLGIYLTGTEPMSGFINHPINSIVLEQQPFWKGDAPVVIAVIVTIAAAIFLFLLFRKEDQKPGGAVWGWKKTVNL